MARKKRLRIWYLVLIITAGCGLVLFAIQQRIIAAEKLLDAYQKSPVCTNSDQCRQTLQGKVKKTKTELIERSVDNWVPKAPKIRLPALSQAYLIEIGLPEHNLQTALISPKEESFSSKSFDFTNIYFPSNHDEYFAINNFQQSQDIKAELWQRQITYLFVDSIKGYTPEDPTQSIAIPTASHPQVILSIAQQDSNNAFIGSVFILTVVILFAIWFSK